MKEPLPVREQIQKLLVTGDNRLKQGAGAEKARQSYERALELAREAGVEDAVRPLVEIRLADLDALGSRSERRSPGQTPDDQDGADERRLSDELAPGSPPPGAPAY